jgi:hypothetical protein
VRKHHRVKTPLITQIFKRDVASHSG